jgi:hypothetical protein
MQRSGLLDAATSYIKVYNPMIKPCGLLPHKEFLILSDAIVAPAGTGPGYGTPLLPPHSASRRRVRPPRPPLKATVNSFNKLSTIDLSRALFSCEFSSLLFLSFLQSMSGAATSPPSP